MEPTLSDRELAEEVFSAVASAIENNAPNYDVAAGLIRNYVERESAKLREANDAAQDKINTVAMQMEQLAARVDTTESERLTWKALAENLRSQS